MIFTHGRNDNYPLTEALEMTARAGFKLIELIGRQPDWQNYADHINRLGLKVWSLHGIMAYEGSSLDEKVRQKAIEAEFAQMENAAVYAPCPYVIHYVDRHNDPGVGAAFRNTIEKLLEKAGALKLNLAIETAPYKPEVDQRYADSKEIAEFVRSFSSPDISICVDINHSNLNENLTDAIANCRGLISTVHISDNHGERENHLFPGQGVIDFPAAIKALRDAGYNGPLNLECGTTEPVTVEVLTKLREWAEKN